MKENFFSPDRYVKIKDTFIKGFCLVALFFAGCGNDSPETLLMGEWRETNSINRVEFAKDGLFVETLKSGSETGHYKFMDSSSETRVHIDFGFSGTVYKIKVSADKMTMKEQGGSEEHYTRLTESGKAYIEGLAHFGKKEYDQAFGLLEKAAQGGETDAFEPLARCYDEGLGTAEDKTNAVAWTLKAAENGSAKAQYEAGMAYLNGRGIEKDDALAVSWLKKAIPGMTSYRKKIKAHALLSKLYATSPDQAVQNGPLAVTHIKEYFNGGGASYWEADDIAATAYARNNEFDTAIKYQEQALKKAIWREKSNDTRREFKAKLKLYALKKPYDRGINLLAPKLK